MLMATDETHLHILVSLWPAGGAAHPEKELLQKHLLVPPSVEEDEICEVGT